MHPYQQPQYQTVNTPTSNTSVFAAGLAGALVSATASTAKAARDVREGSKTRSEALCNVVTESLGSGLAMAVGAAVAKPLFRSGPAGLITMLAVGVGVKYAYDGFTRSACSKVAVDTTETKNS